MDNVDVLVSFTKHSVIPHVLRWGSKQYQIRQVNLVHSLREGQTRVHFFSVSDGANYFKLGFNTETMKWWVEDNFVQ